LETRKKTVPYLPTMSREGAQRKDSKSQKKGRRRKIVIIGSERESNGTQERVPGLGCTWNWKIIEDPVQHLVKNGKAPGSQRSKSSRKRTDLI